MSRPIDQPHCHRRPSQLFRSGPKANINIRQARRRRRLGASAPRLSATATTFDLSCDVINHANGPVSEEH